MLRQITITDYALVDKLSVSFSGGLTVITGESGAGKSIMLGGLSLVLGRRASSDAVRHGAKKADLSAEFDLTDNTAARALIDQHELHGEDDSVLLRRVVSAEGRSRAFVNSVPVTLAVLTELAETLIDVQAQDEHMRISDSATQLNLLDDYAGSAPEATKVRESYRAWHAAEARASALQAEIDAARDRQDLVRYQLSELDELALGADEFESLESTYKRLSGAQGIRIEADRAMAALDNLDEIGRAARALGSIDDDHASLATARELLDGALAQLEEAGFEVRAYAESLTVDGAELAEIEKRLDRAQDLARKHRVRPAELPAHTDALRAELDGVDVSEGELAELRETADAERKRFTTAAKKLGKARRKAAKAFEKAVSETMQQLGIKGGAIQLDFTDEVSERGLEKVDYLVVTNPKMPPAPLAKVASGGERTRIALSVQVVAAERTRLPTLVLDEADVGIGGTTADILGRMLKRLGQSCQVLCVTHAPQVAALGDTHLLVHKAAKSGTAVSPLEDDGRLEELSRMLAGADVTDETRSYAATLLADGALA